jgi:hypothetical protein
MIIPYSQPGSWNRLSRPCPADWGSGMTVCIAAMADVGKSIVIACDSMISTGEVSGDRVAFKIYPLGTNEKVWVAMMAGDDISQVSPVIQEANSRLLGIQANQLTTEAVGNEFVAAYQSVRRKYAQDQILSPFGITMEDFRNNGLQIFGDSYREVAADLTRIDLGCQFLLAGFDRDGDGHILSVSNPGIVKHHDPVGFWAIGSGSYSALSMLFYHSIRADLPLPLILYHTCEAKFMAESAFGVGKHSTVQIITHDSRPQDLVYEQSQEFVSEIRRAWETDGRPHVPQWAIAGIGSDIAKLPVIARREKPKP